MAELKQDIGAVLLKLCKAHNGTDEAVPIIIEELSKLISSHADHIAEARLMVRAARTWQSVANQLHKQGRRL